jgi:hypothetical protein
MRNLLPFEYCKRANLYALIITITHSISPDLSMQYMRLFPYRAVSKLIDVQDVVEMVRLQKSGKSLKEIGELFHMNRLAVHKRISRYLKKNNIK